MPKNPWQINIQNSIFPFFWVSKTLKFIVTSIKQQIIEIKSIKNAWYIMFKMEQSKAHKIRITIEEENNIWWKVNFVSKVLKMKAPRINPIDLLKNRIAYSV